MKLMTTGTAATADYPDIPDEGVLCSDGAYVNFTTTDVTAFKIFPVTTSLSAVKKAPKKALCWQKKAPK